MANQEHLEILEQGRKEWNSWRTDNPQIIPDLRDAILSGKDLFNVNLNDAILDRAQFLNSNLEETQFRGASMKGAVLKHATIEAANFSYANLVGANLERTYGEDAILENTILYQASLEHADLWWADFKEAKLQRANLRFANLHRAILEKADLTDADLTRAILTQTNLKGAILIRTRIYGLSVWDVELDETTIQRDLSIAPPNLENKSGGEIKVDNIEVAQLINLLLNHKNLRKVLTTVSGKAVLILGRFQDKERKNFLESIYKKLKDIGLLPIIFDFEKLNGQDFTETIKVLAGLSLFVIADVTAPRSVQLELQATVPDYMVPFVLILKKGEPAFSMLTDLQVKYKAWVLPLIKYESEENLLGIFHDVVTQPALRKHNELVLMKAQKPEEIDVEALLKQKYLE